MTTSARRGGFATYLFLVPFTALFVVFLLYPAIYSIQLSFYGDSIYADLYHIFTTMPFVGLANYEKILADRAFFWSLFMTAYYAVLLIPLSIAIALALAVLLDNRLRGVNFFRSAFFFPYILDLFVVGVIWTAIYAPNYGAAHQVFALLDRTVGTHLVGEGGVFAEGILNHPAWSMVGVVFAVALKNCGFGMILYLAAIQNIPASIYEAAAIDGATPWQRLTRVTIPLVRPITLLLTVTGILGALSAFAEIYAMTAGAPSYTLPGGVPYFGGSTQQMTRVAGYYLFQQFYEARSYGYAAAISVVLFLIALPISLAAFFFFNPEAPTLLERRQRFLRRFLPAREEARS